jgi:hypothetical protein
MPGIFDALPGIDTPVSSISGGLAKMWAGNEDEGKPSPGREHAKAIQVNFVLLLGLKTSTRDAVHQFDVAVRFSRRHPSRVVVLCPLPEGSGATEMRAKVYGECTIGKTPEDTRCCEFVMLSYPRGVKAHLENQVSICLSTDLPLYFWAHGFSEAARLADYTYLMTTAKRVILDSATAPAGALDFPWPRPENVRDLAFARLLPVRQSIGQFLSRYPMPSLTKGLVSVKLVHGSKLGAEARVLMKWLAGRIGECWAGRQGFSVERSSSLAPTGLNLAFSYADKRFFRWKADISKSSATFDADFGTGRTAMRTTLSLLPEENALSEAMFF